jgi:HK97 family phage major capsid protein
MGTSQALSKYRAEKADLKIKLDEISNQVQAADGKLSDSLNLDWQKHLARGNELDQAIQMELDRIEFESNLDALPKEEAEAIASFMNPAVKKQVNPFKSLGEQIQAAAIAIQSKGAVIDPRLLEVNAAISGAGTMPLEDGAYLIQGNLQSILWQIATNTGALASRCTKMPLGAGFKSIEVPVVRDYSRADGSRWGGVTVYRAAEAATVDPTKIKFDKWEVTPSAMMALAYFTHEILRDAPLVEALTKEAIGQEFGVTLDEEIYTGAGGGQCLGFMNSGSKISVSKETGQAAASLVPQNIAKMYNRLWAPWRANAVWFYNQDIEPQLHLMTLPVGTAGVPVFLPPAGLTAAPNGMLYGKPMFPLENCPTLGTEGDLIFADMSQYVLVEKEGIRIDRSEHVRFLYDEIAVRFKLENGGQAKYNEKITPKKGTNTYSAFVTLATRA